MDLAAPLDAADLAVREIMEVLLNAPELFGEADKALADAGISDPRLSRIVERFLADCAGEREYDLAGFMSGFEEPADAAFITDMQFAGERRGNYEATLRGAMERLKEELARREETLPVRGTADSAVTRLAHAQTRSERRRRFAGAGSPLPLGESQAANLPLTGAVPQGDDEQLTERPWR